MQIRIVIPGRKSDIVEFPPDTTLLEAIESIVTLDEAYRQELNYRPAAHDTKLKDGDVIILTPRYMPRKV